MRQKRSEQMVKFVERRYERIKIHMITLEVECPEYFFENPFILRDAMYFRLTSRRIETHRCLCDVTQLWAWETHGANRYGESLIV